MTGRLLAASALVLALHGAGAGVSAQEGTGAAVSPERPRSAPARLAPPLLAEAVQDPATLIRIAATALAERRLAEAAELLERAETRLLTRAELATEADRPAVGGLAGDLAAARDAIGRGDAGGAEALLAGALLRLEQGEASALLGRPGSPSVTGAPAAPPPAWGGGRPALPTPPHSLPPLPTSKPPPA